MSTLGLGPICAISMDDDSILEVKLGLSGSVTIGNTVNLLPGFIRHRPCAAFIRTFVFL